MRSSPTVATRTVNSPKGSWASVVTGVTCATVAASSSSFGGGASLWWWRSGVISCSYGCGVTSSCSFLNQEALGWLVAAWLRQANRG
jgi:hypothetical protein